MKKILLIIAIIMAIFQMVVLATAIDIGSAAVDGSNLGVNTLVDMNNPADGTGKITTVEIWATIDMAGAKVATFFVVSGNNLSTRDYETIDNGNGAGVVIAGSKQIFTVDLDVEEGDYIGIRYSSGGIAQIVAGVGRWYISSDQIPCIDTLFQVYASRTISLYGTGATEEEEEEANAIFFGTNF